jgi:competence protein ComEC
MWLGMLAAAAGQVTPALGAPLDVVAGPLLAYLAWLAHVAGEAPLAVLPVRLGWSVALALGCVLPAALALAARALWRRASERAPAGPSPALRRFLVGAVVAGAASGVVVVRHTAMPTLRAPPNGLVVSFLDIGQGDATLIQDGAGANVLFDGGPPEGHVMRQLKRADVHHLDLVIATHQSRDHQGGLHEVLAHIPIRLLLENGDGHTIRTSCD